MMRAQEADPTNLEVLLALGVSHTNGQSVTACPISQFITKMLPEANSLIVNHDFRVNHYHFFGF